MTTAAEMRDLYILAEQDILQHGQSTAFKGQQLTVADLAEIRRGRREWEQRAAQEANSAAKVGGLPHSLGSFSTRGRS